MIKFEEYDQITRRVEIRMKDPCTIVTHEMIGDLDSDEHWIILEDVHRVVQYIPKYDIESMAVHPFQLMTITDEDVPEDTRTLMKDEMERCMDREKD